MLVQIILYVLRTVEVLVSLLLIGAILIQRTRSQGMGLAFGAGMGETIFGAQVGNVLTRATVVMSIIFLVTTTLLAMLGVQGQARSVADSVTDSAAGVPSMPAPMAPPPVTPGGGGDDFALPHFDAGAPVSVPVESMPIEIPAAESAPMAPVAPETAAPEAVMPPAVDAVPATP
jgi:preprotein translocase subunit SecG